MNSPHPIDAKLVNYYVKKSNQSSSSPTAVDGLHKQLIIDGSSVSPESVADMAKEFLARVLGRAINHLEYREDGLVCGTTDLRFALESMARDHLLRREREQERNSADAAMEEEEDDEYVPEEIAAEDAAEDDDADATNEDKLVDDEMNEDGDDDEDFLPGDEDVIGDDDDAMDDAEEEGSDVHAVTPDSQQDDDAAAGDWNLNHDAPVFTTLFPITPDEGGTTVGLTATQFQALWGKACAEANSTVDVHTACQGLMRQALNAYLTKVLPVIGVPLSNLHRAMEDEDMEASGNDVWRIASPFVGAVMKVAIIHMGHSQRMRCGVVDFNFALDFIAREQMQSQVLSVLEGSEDEEGLDTPLFNSIFPEITNDGDADDDNDDEDGGSSSGGLSFVQIQDLWNEALKERGVAGAEGTWLRPLDVAVYRPLKRALDSYIVAGIHPGEQEPRQLDADLSRHG